MANPIYTFKDKKTQERYFLFWDTFYELPKTIPMKLLTFLQYWGIDNKEKVSVLYAIYPRLIETGTSLSDFSFDKQLDYLKEDCYNTLEHTVDTPSEQEMEFNQQLEDLFESDLPFFEFYQEYVALISGINHHTKRPANYYLSWYRTASCFGSSDYRFQESIATAAEQNGLSVDELNCELDDIHSCLESNIFQQYPTFIIDFFLHLGQHNLIAIDAIPHEVRKEKSIQELFGQFGMEAYLPNTNINYDLYETNEPVYQTLNELPYLRQFINLYAFDGNEQNLIGIDILHYTESELIDLLEENYCSVNELVNFKNSQGSFLLPMMYTTDHVFDGEARFLFLAPFGQQAYHIVSTNGKVFDRVGYYDFYSLSEHVMYVQYTQGLSWIRWSYDEETNTIDKQPISVENTYDENVWEDAEERFLKAQLENRAANQENQFALIQLAFKLEERWNYLFLSNSSEPTQEQIENDISERLNTLLFDEEDLTDGLLAGIETYKSMLSSTSRMDKYVPASLHRFQMRFINNDVNQRFQQSYTNDDFAQYGIHEEQIDRATTVFYSIHLADEQVSFLSHFKVTNSCQEFEEDCNQFVELHPLRIGDDINEYGLKFETHLVEKGYEKISFFIQALDIDGIRELLGIELNAEGRFDSPDQSVNANDDDDDFPF